MDYHSLTRKQLQSLCKHYAIPANKTNVAMADALESLNLSENAAVNYPLIDAVDSPLPTSVARGRTPLGTDTRAMARTTRSRLRAEREDGEPKSAVREVPDSLPEVNGLPELLKTPQTAVQSGRRITRSSAQRQIQKIDDEGDDVTAQKLDLASAVFPEKEKTIASSSKASRRKKDVKQEETKKDHKIPAPPSSTYSTRRSARLRVINPASDRPSAKENLEKILADVDENEPLDGGNKLPTCNSTVGPYQGTSIDVPEEIPSSVIQFSHDNYKDEEQLLRETSDGSNTIFAQEKCTVEEGNGGETELDNGSDNSLLSVEVSQENASIHGNARLFPGEFPQKNDLSSEISFEFPGEAPAYGNTLSVETISSGDESPRKNDLTNEISLEFPGASPANGHVFSVKAISNEDESSGENNPINELSLEFLGESPPNGNSSSLQAILNEGESPQKNDFTNEILLESPGGGPTNDNTFSVEAISGEDESPHKSTLTNEISYVSPAQNLADDNTFSVEVISNEEEPSYTVISDGAHSQFSLPPEACQSIASVEVKSDGEESCSAAGIDEDEEVHKSHLEVIVEGNASDEIKAYIGPEESTNTPRDSDSKTELPNLLASAEGEDSFNVPSPDSTPSSQNVTIEHDGSVEIIGNNSEVSVLCEAVKLLSIESFGEVQQTHLTSPPSLRAWGANSAQQTSPLANSSISKTRKSTGNASALTGGTLSGRKKKVRMISEASMDKENDNASGTKATISSVRKVHKSLEMDKENNNVSGTKLVTLSGRKVRMGILPLTDKDSKNGSGMKDAASLSAKKVRTELLMEILSIDEDIGGDQLNGRRKVRTGIQSLTDKDIKNGSGMKVHTELLMESLSTHEDKGVNQLSGGKMRIGIQTLTDMDIKSGSDMMDAATSSAKKVHTELLESLSTNEKDNDVDRLMNLSLRKLKKMVKEREIIKNNARMTAREPLSTLPLNCLP